MRITECKITKVDTHPQELKDGDSRVTTTAHITGKLTKPLAKTIAGADGVGALFGADSWVTSVKLKREDGACRVAFMENDGDRAMLVLNTAGAHTFAAKTKDKTVSFEISCEQGGKELYNHHQENPLWQGSVEITAQQGALFEKKQ